jgi:autotransporter-associated beta strand protein
LYQVQEPEAAPAALLTTFTWTGGTSTNWSTAGNWSPSGGPPTNGDTATFSNNSATVNNRTTISIGTANISNILFDTANSAAYTLGTSVGSGTINLNNGGAITVTSSVTNNEVINSDIVLGSESAATSFTFANDGTSNTLTIAGSVSTNPSNGDHPSWTLNLNGAGNSAITGNISGNGTGNGSGTQALLSVSKSGAGTWTLSGANTYAGGTSVTVGTLLVNNSTGSGTGSGAVTVNNSGTMLGGTGSISGSVTINANAKLQGGVGTTGTTLTLAGTLTLADNSIVQLALGPGLTHSTLARSGTNTWTFDSNQAFTFLNLGATTGTYQNIITNIANPPSEELWTITNPGFIGTFVFDGANIDLNLTAVPEPSTWIAGALTLGALGWAQLRRFSRGRSKFGAIR